MTLSNAAHMGLATAFLLSTTGAAMAYAPPKTASLDHMRDWDINKMTALNLACRNPGGGFRDDLNVYFKVDDGLTALAIPIAYFVTHYDPDAQKISIPENAARIVCPV